MFLNGWLTTWKSRLKGAHRRTLGRHRHEPGAAVGQLALVQRVQQLEDRCLLAVALEVTGAASLNVRSGPGTEYPILTTIALGQKFVATDQTNGWSHIDLPALSGPRSGWVSTAYTSESPQATRVEVQGTEGLGLRIRTGPGVSYSRLDQKIWDTQQFVAFAQAPAGDGSSHSWYQIYLAADSGTPSGWSSGDYLSVLSSTAAPDLVPQTVTVNQANVQPGDTVTIGFSITNQGNAYAGPTTTRLRLSSSASGNSLSDPVLADVNIPGLAAGEMTTRTATATIPSGTTFGTYYVWAIADNWSAILQGDTRNDFARSPALSVNSTVHSQPDLVPAQVTLSDNVVQPGATVTVSFTIANQGNSAARASKTGLRLSTSAQNTSPGSDVLLINLDTPSISAGQSVSQQANVTIPSGTQPGTYYIWAVADNVLNSDLNQSNTNNDYTHSTALTVNLPAAPTVVPDLAVQNLLVSPSTGEPGSKVTVQFTIHNQGNGPSNSFQTNVRLAASNHTVTTSDPPLATGVLAAALDPGESISFSREVVIPTLESGDYRVWVIADVNSEAGQRPIDEKNDKLNTAFRVATPQAATPTPIHRELRQLPQTAFDGANEDFAVNLSNVGPGQSVQVAVGLSNAELRSLGTFTNTSGVTPWTIEGDLKTVGLAAVNYVQISSVADVGVLSLQTTYTTSDPSSTVSMRAGGLFC